MAKEMINNALQYFNDTSNNIKVLDFLKFTALLIDKDTICMKSIIKEHQNDAWFKEIIHLGRDMAIKLMVKNQDTEGVRLLLGSDLIYRWDEVDKSQVYQKVIEHEWLDTTNKDLISFSQISKHPLEDFSKSNKLKKFVYSYIVTFLTGGTVKYIPYKIKAIQSHPNDPSEANNKYRELVQKQFDEQPDCDVHQHTVEAINNPEISTLGIINSLDCHIG